jgi:hypothetical protein
MNVTPSRHSRRRFVVVALMLGVFAAIPSLWASAQPESALRLKVIAALTAHEVWAVGTDVHVSGTEVRLQGFVRSEADRARVLEVASAVSGVGRVRDQLSLTAWPTPGPVADPAQVALLAASVD